MENFWPAWSIAIPLYFAFQYASLENYRAMRATPAYSASAFSVIVTISAAVTTLFGIAWLIAYGFDHGWLRAVGLYVLIWLATAVASFTRGMILGRLFGTSDSTTLWVLGTAALWPLMIALGLQVSWGGLLK